MDFQWTWRAANARSMFVLPNFPLGRALLKPSEKLATDDKRHAARVDPHANKLRTLAACAHACYVRHSDSFRLMIRCTQAAKLPSHVDVMLIYS